MSWNITDQVNGNIKFFGSQQAYKNTIQAKLAAGLPLDDPAAARAFAPELFSKDNTPIPTGSSVEKQGDWSKSGSSSEDNGGKSNNAVPAQSHVDNPTNVGLLQGQQNTDLDVGGTVNGVVMVAGNLLDTLSAWGNFLFGFAGQYAKPLLIMGGLIAFSKVFSWKKKS